MSAAIALQILRCLAPPKPELPTTGGVVSDERRSSQVEPCGDDLVKVTGPAVVHSPGGEYEIKTDITLKFPAESEVWVKVWGDDV